MIFKNRKKEQLRIILNDAIKFGLPEDDAKDVEEFIENREYGPALEHIATQIYEYEIEIDVNFYERFIAFSKKLSIQPGTYSYLSECIKGDKKPPSSLHQGISKIIDALKKNV